MKNIAAIAIDVQVDFAYGALGTKEAKAALPTIRSIKEYCYEHDYLVIHTQDTHYEDRYFDSIEGKKLPVLHTIIGTEGWEICPEIKVLPYEQGGKVRVKKYTFGSTVLPEYLRALDYTCKFDEIWLFGFCTDICVSANYQILKANYPNTRIVVISDACAGVTPDTHNAAVEIMKMCHADIMTWEELKKEQENGN